MPHALRLLLVLALLAVPVHAQDAESEGPPLFDEMAYLDFVLEDGAMDALAEEDDAAIAEEELAELADPRPFVSAMAGEVTAQAPGTDKPEAAFANMAMPWGSVLTVPDGGSAEVTWPNGTVVTAKGGAKFAVEQAAVRLATGAAVVDYPGLPGGFAVETPRGRAACRGTIYETALVEVDGKEALQVSVYGGAVQVEQGDATTRVAAGTALTAVDGAFSTEKVDPETMALYAEAMAGEEPEPAYEGGEEPAPVEAPAPATPATRLTPAAGPQGGLLNMDAAKPDADPAAGIAGAPAAPGADPVPGAVGVSAAELELLEISNGLSEAIGNLTRIQKRNLKPAKGSDEVALVTVAGTATTFKPVRNAPLAQLYAYLNARAGVMARLHADDLQPYGSWKVQSLLEAHKDFLKSGRPPANRTEWLVKRIEHLHRTVLPETIRKTDRRLVAWSSGRNPFALFTAFRKLAVKAEFRMKLEMDKKRALNKMKKATKLRRHKLLNTPGIPVGTIDPEIMEINHLLENLRGFYTLGDAVPEGWMVGAGDPAAAAACKAQVEGPLFAALEKYAKEKRALGTVSMAQLVKQGCLPAALPCPLNHDYRMMLSRNKAGNTVITVRCIVHPPLVKELGAGDVTAGRCAAFRADLEAAARKYMLEVLVTAPGAPPAAWDIAIKDLIRKKCLKTAVNCPNKGKYAIKGSFDAEGRPVITVTCDVHAAK